MYALKLTIWILLITLIESVFGTYLEIGSIMPDLLFTFALCFSAMRIKFSEIITVGIICGVLADCLSGRIFGNYTVIFLVSVVLLFIIKENFFKNGFIFNILIVFLFTLIGKSLFFVMNIFILKDIGYWYSLFSIILPEALYNTAISLLFIPAIKRTFKGKAGFVYR